MRGTITVMCLIISLIATSVLYQLTIRDLNISIKNHKQTIHELRYEATRRGMANYAIREEYGVRVETTFEWVEEDEH